MFCLLPYLAEQSFPLRLLLSNGECPLFSTFQISEKTGNGVEFSNLNSIVECNPK